MTAGLADRLGMRRRGRGLPERLEALREVVELGEGRLPAEPLAEARAVLARAGERLRLSGEHTVVALAGATGSGKSSLFNALTGKELSSVGVRRPTTSHAHAAVWGANEAVGPLLAWLDARSWHAVDPPADGAGPGEPSGLVLLDLPDHDSTEQAHRVEVDRLVQLVDLLVWVVDPQKYADAALHERYLRPLAGHGAVTVVVLNQVDRLPPAAAEQCLADLRRLLADDGLADARVLPVSARTGTGVPELRALLGEAVRRREALTDRLSADVTRVVAALVPHVGEEGGDVGERERVRLVDALAAAAGVPAVVDAVGRSYVMRSVAVTGWPFTRWVRRLRPDPLRRLRLEPERVRGPADAAPGRTSLPGPTPVARSQVDTAVRAVVSSAAGGVAPEELEALRRAAAANEEDLSDALDRAVAGTDLGVARRPLWWGALGALQWLLAAATVVGVLWLVLLFVVQWFQLPTPPTPDVDTLADVPLPTLLALGGALAGLLAALVGRILARVGAGRRRRRAARRLRGRIAEVAEGHVLVPVQQELDAYRRLRRALTRASPG